MTLKFYLALVCAILTISLNVNAQCINVTLSSQAEVDSYPITHGCPVIVNSLTISGNDITNLAALSGIISVGTLQVINNPNLESLNGLERLTIVGVSCLCINKGLIIRNNLRLANIDGLTGVRSVAGMVDITNNPLLTNINGLSHLTSLGRNTGFGDQSIVIKNNPMLASLEPLAGVSDSVGGVYIIDNDALTDLYGLHHINKIYGPGLEISGNAALTSLRGISKVSRVDLKIVVSWNRLLPNLNGFRSLYGISMVNGSSVRFEVSNNQSLINVDSLSGFQSFEGVGADLVFTNNPKLKKGCGLFTLINKKENDCPGCVAYDFSGSGITKEEILAGGPCQLTDPQPGPCDGDITLSSQADIDAFPANYGCSIVGGWLTISGNDIANLDSLYQLTKVANLNINNCPELTDVSGLSSLQSADESLAIAANNKLTSTHGFESLKSVGALNILSQGNMDLTGFSGLTAINGSFTLEWNSISSLHGLENVEKIGGELMIRSDAGLVSLDGLAGVKEIGFISFFDNINLETMGMTSLESVGKTQMYNNAKLDNLDGLSSLTSIGDLIVNGNPKLTSIQGLSSVTTVAGRLWLANNPMLVSLAGLENVKTLPSSLEISNNDSLADLDGLTIETITGSLLVNDNGNLQSLHGLESLTTVGSGCGCPLSGMAINNNPKLLNVDQLASLTSIGGVIQIQANQSLINLEGLSALTSVGKNTNFGDQSIDIERNPALRSINGLRNLSGVMGRLVINDNNVLPTLDGLEKITQAGGLFVMANDSLANINGLSSLNTVNGGVIITDNNYLQDLDGLRSLRHVAFTGGATMRISNYPALTNVDSLSSFTDLGGPSRRLTVTDNTNLTRGCGFYNLLNTSFCEGCSGQVTFSGNGAGVTEAEIRAAGPCEGGNRSENSRMSSDLAFSDVTDNSMNVSFTKGEGNEGYITLMRAFESALPDEGPQDGLSYSVGDVIGCCTIVVGKGMDTTLNVLYLEPDIDYYFDIIPYTAGNDYDPDKVLSGYQRTMPQSQPYPNPFVENITIPFTISEEGSNVRILIFDQTGRPVSEVVNDRYDRGKHYVTWNRLDMLGNRATNGVYIYSITTNSNEPVKGMFVAK